MRRTRSASLKAAVLLAVGFVALRVLYRVLFGGVDGTGILLLELPAIRLAGPFAHITLLGPITTGGLASAALSAVPFAALVLVIGVIAAVVNLHALLARGAARGPVRTVSRALVVASATFPALLDSVRRVRLARELRGERGAASLVVPVLEHTVERAIALGASMEVRGFAAAKRVEPDCERPAVLRNAYLGYGGTWIVENLTLTPEPGTLTLITGATGSGKSTLLHAMSGLFQHVSGGEQAGTVEVVGVDRVAVPPRETAGCVGVVSQSVRLSFVASTVAEELGFALAARGVDAVIVEARTVELADRLQIRHLLDREIGALSAGEACLVAIGAALAEHPVLLLVDEPLADLDDDARARVIGVLDRLAHEAGVCVIVAEHVIGEWGTVPDARIELRAPASDTAPRHTPEPVTGSTIARIDNLSVAYADRTVVHEASLSLASGEIVALRGPNGAGKSSLLHAVARPTRQNTVLVDGRDVFALHRRERRHVVALVPENFDDLLFSATVAEECRRADGSSGGQGTLQVFARVVGVDVEAIMQRHPRDLSAGERLCLVLAIQLSARPTLLLVDEPTRGLDAGARALVGRVLLEAASTGTAVLVATHDRSFADRHAGRVITMAHGRIEPATVVPR